MADTKVSALPAVSTPAGTDEFPVNQGGASKKMTLSQVVGFAPTVPAVRSVTAEFSSTGVPTATLPTGHTTNDILLLVIQSANDSAVTPPAGYARIGPQNGVGDAAAAGATKLSVFWKRDGGSESAPTIPDTGDHTYGFMAAISGCPTTGDPFHFLGQAWKFTASTTATSCVSRTSVDNCLIVDIFAHAWDNTTANATGQTNSDLTSITEQFDDSTSDGTGGGLVMVSGVKATAGPIGATTMTWTNSTVDVSLRIAFLPLAVDPNHFMARPPEQMVFIGSSADLDDTWTKPSGAREVFAQICEGGGGGSGGNTTTTAAGGGGGGGGGYDEAWFRADDLAATVTVHAGKGGAAGTALLQAGNAGVVSEFDKGNKGPLTSSYRKTGTAATAAASADGGNGGCGSGVGIIAVQTTRQPLSGTTATNATGLRGAAGGSGTTSPTGGSEGSWGGGGGESGADTDAVITSG